MKKNHKRNLDLIFIYLFLFLATYKQVMKNCTAEDDENKSYESKKANILGYLKIHL